MTAMYICHRMARVNHILLKKNFSSHSDFASQYELSPAPFPPNIPLKSTSSRHKFLHKMQEGGHWPTLDMKSEKAENRNSLCSARGRALNSHILIIELSTLLTGREEFHCGESPEASDISTGAAFT